MLLKLNYLFLQYWKLVVLKKINNILLEMKIVSHKISEKLREIMAKSTRLTNQNLWVPKFLLLLKKNFRPRRI